MTPPKPSKPSKPSKSAPRKAPAASLAKTGRRKAGGHDRRVCGGKTRAGGACGRPAGWGTGHPGVGRCKLHGGKTPTHERAGAREIAESAQAAAIDRLGLVATGTNAIDALQDALDRAKALVMVAAVRVQQLEPTQWAQRDSGGKFLRPSVYLEIYWRNLDTYARIARDCLSLGIAAAAVDAVRRDAEQVQTLLQAFVHELGMRWDDEPVRLALVAAIERLEGAA